MFGIDIEEFLVIIVVAIVFIGPKDMPMALRTAGRWMGKVRRVSGHFRSGIETMIREAELEEMEAKWREQNAAIMTAHPDQTADTDSHAATEAALGVPPASELGGLPPVSALGLPPASAMAPLPKPAAADAAPDVPPAGPS